MVPPGGRAAVGLILAAACQSLGAQSADLYFQGVLLVEPAAPVEEAVPADAGGAMGALQGAMGMGATGNATSGTGAGDASGNAADGMGAGGAGNGMGAMGMRAPGNAADGTGAGSVSRNAGAMGGTGVGPTGTAMGGTGIGSTGAGMGGMGMGASGSATGAADAAGPAPVLFFMPARRRSEVALVLIPGGGLSSWSYTATPDGRDGWAQQFARAGVPVYLMNPPAGFRQELGRWNRETVWPLWGMGPEFGVLHPESKHPVEAIDNLHASFHIARAPGGAAHLRSLLDRIGPAVVLAHSAGGAAMFSAAQSLHPDLRGAIAVETTNCPTDEAALRRVYVEGDRAFLSLWADNLDRGAPSMLNRYASCRRASDIIAAAGGRAETVHLPEDRGIRGNTHLMMQDTNSHEIGAMILAWLGAEFGDDG